jgi:thiamine pyrophosphate-dependent acetolactate synthase large subunit-like protein
MLRDYEAIYRDYRLRQARFADLYLAAERDRQYMQEACADAQRQEQFVQKEQDELKADQKARHEEANAAHTHLAALEQKLTLKVKEVAAMIEDNLTLAADIAKTQLEAARCIDERTRTIARGGGGTAATGTGTN